MRYAFDKEHGYTLGRGVLHRVLKCLKRETDISYLHALLLDSESGTLDGLPVNLVQTPSILKAAHKDPDTPTMMEALNGPYREEFLKAMRNEIAELEAHGTWKLLPWSEIGDAKVLPSTWAFKIKRYPDGRMRKVKA